MRTKKNGEKNNRGVRASATTGVQLLQGDARESAKLMSSRWLIPLKCSVWSQQRLREHPIPVEQETRVGLVPAGSGCARGQLKTVIAAAATAFLQSSGNRQGAQAGQTTPNDGVTFFA